MGGGGINARVLYRGVGRSSKVPGAGIGPDKGEANLGGTLPDISKTRPPA